MLNQQTSILQSRYRGVSTMRKHKITPISARHKGFVRAKTIWFVKHGYRAPLLPVSKFNRPWQSI